MCSCSRTRRALMSEGWNKTVFAVCKYWSLSLFSCYRSSSWLYLSGGESSCSNPPPKWHPNPKPRSWRNTARLTWWVGWRHGRCWELAARTMMARCTGQRWVVLWRDVTLCLWKDIRPCLLSCLLSRNLFFAEVSNPEYFSVSYRKLDCLLNSSGNP